MYEISFISIRISLLSKFINIFLIFKIKYNKKILKLYEKLKL